MRNTTICSTPGSSRKNKKTLRVLQSTLAAVLVAALAACGSTSFDGDELDVRYGAVVSAAAESVNPRGLDRATVAGTISLYVRDNPRLTEVHFQVSDADGATVLSHADDEAPFTMDLDTRRLSNGLHTLDISSRVTRGQALSASLDFSVQNDEYGEEDEGRADEGDVTDDDPSDAETPGTENPSHTDTPETGVPAVDEDEVEDGDTGEDDVSPSEPTQPDEEDDGRDAGEQDGGLTWAPPHLDDPTIVRVTQSTRGVTVRLDRSRDYIVEMPDEPLRSGLKIDGGRNVVLIGGEIDIPWQGDDPTVQARTGLRIANATGTVHVEGLLIHGDDISEGIQVAAPDAIVQIQNVGIFDIHARDQVNFSDNHPDIIQTYGNVRALRVDRLTGSTDYQGLMLKVDDFGSGTDPHGPITLKRVNLIGNPTARYLMWIRPEDDHGTITMEDVWFDVDEGRSGGLGKSIWPDVNASWAERLTVGTDEGSDYAWWPELAEPTVLGGIREGRPATGDYVQRASVGITYASPGYGVGSTLLASR